MAFAQIAWVTVTSYCSVMHSASCEPKNWVGSFFESGSVLSSTKNAQMLVHVGAADVIFVCFQSGFAPTAPTFQVHTLLVQCTSKVHVGASWCKIDYSDLTKKEQKKDGCFCLLSYNDPVWYCIHYFLLEMLM